MSKWFDLVETTISEEMQLAKLQIVIEHVNARNHSRIFGEMSPALKAINDGYFDYHDIERLRSLCYALGYGVTCIDEGNLQDGTWFLDGDFDLDGVHYPSFFVEEEYVNCWETGQTITVYEHNTDVPEEVWEKVLEAIEREEMEGA